VASFAVTAVSAAAASAAASSVPGLASLDAGTAIQIIYSALSVAERKVGTVQNLQCVLADLYYNC
jgi:hypothetical protein